MSVESISSIVSGEKPIDSLYQELEELKIPEEEQEVKESVERMLEDYKESNTDSWRLSMGCGKILFSQAVPILLEEDIIRKKMMDGDKEAKARYSNLDKQLHLIANTVEIFFRKNVKPDKGDWEAVLSGFTAEVACAVSLKQGGFDVYIPSKEDDEEGKIDLLVYNNSDNILIPLQIKSSSLLRDIIVEQVSREKDIEKVIKRIEQKWDKKLESYNANIIDLSAEKLIDMKKNTTNSSEGLLKYLKPIIAKDNGVGIIPVVVAIPGGESENAMYNCRTGASLQDKNRSTSYLSNLLCDNIFAISDKYKEEHGV